MNDFFQRHCDDRHREIDRRFSEQGGTNARLWNQFEIVKQDREKALKPICTRMEGIEHRQDTANKQFLALLLLMIGNAMTVVGACIWAVVKILPAVGG